MNPTKTTDTLPRLWRRLGVWRGRRWSAYLGGLACAAVSGTLLLAGTQRQFPPAFAPAPRVAAPTPAPTPARQGPDLFPPSASAIPTIDRQGPDLFPPPAMAIPTTVRKGPGLVPAGATAPKVLSVSAIQPAAPPKPPPFQPPPPAPAPPQPLPTTRAQPALPAPRELSITPARLSRDEAVRWALQYNPEIAAVRQQHGFARGSIIIANTYPFNPTVETRVRGANGPESAGITNRVDVEINMLWEVELRGQKRLRQQGAAAELSRTDSDIAFQELTLAVRAGRAYDTLFYRFQKAAVADEAVSLTKEDVDRVRRLVDAKLLKPVDLIIIQSELNDFSAQANAAHAQVAPAQTDLQRALGIVDRLEIHDSFETAPLKVDPKMLVELAIERRPDHQAREAAVAEAEARLRLEEANRYGNISVGSSYGYDPSRINTVGGIVSVPIPAFNQHSGEIRQRSAERDRAVLELRQTEIGIVHDVEGALARMEKARRWADAYRTTILPEAKAAVEGIERLFRAADPSVDVLRLIDVRRKLLRARDGYLDALWELRQAQADLAAALGDPALLAPSLRGLCVPPPHP